MMIRSKECGFDPHDLVAALLWDALSIDLPYKRYPKSDGLSL